MKTLFRISVLVCSLGFFAVPARSTINFVQQTRGENRNSVTTFSVSYANSVAPGNALFVFVETRNIPNCGPITVTIADNVDGSWTPIGNVVADYVGSCTQAQWYYFPNAAGGATTVTATINIPEPIAMNILEYSGIATSGALDTSAGALVNAVSNTVTTPTVTTSNANDLILAGIGSIPSNFGTLSVASPYVLRSDASFGNSSMVAEQIVSASGSIAGAAFTAEYIGEVEGITVAFKGAAAGGSGGNATVILCPNNGQTGNNANCVSSPTLAFGNQGSSTASAALAISVNNCSTSQIAACTGTGNLTLGSSYYTITGTNSSDFSNTGQGSCSNNLTIPPGSSCTVVLRFTPSQAAGTNESAVFTVNSNSVTGAQTMSLTGTSASVTLLSSSSCPTGLSANTLYQLTSDITCPTSGFQLLGSGIDVNLNGHTLTYGSTTQTFCVAGIYAAVGWDPEFTNVVLNGNRVVGGCYKGNPTNGPGTESNVTIHNGTITNGSCLNPDDEWFGSDAIHFGQSSNPDNDSLQVFNMTFNLCSQSNMAFSVDGGGGSGSVHDNVVNSRVVTAYRRDHYLGIPFNGGGGGSSSGTTNFYNNTVFGGPQGGIVWGSSAVAINNNLIKQGNPNASPGWLNGGSGSIICGDANANPYTNAAGTAPANAGTQCSNDFGLYNQAANGAVHHNLVLANEGRGITLSGGCFNPPSCTGSSGQTLHDDTMIAQEFPNNSEYTGCEIGGAWGLEWRDGPVNSTIHNENVTAIANHCLAGAFRTQYVSNYNNVSHNNTYAARRAVGAPSNYCTGYGTNSDCAFAGAFLGAGNSSIPTQFTSQNDTFIADSAFLYFDWDASPNQGLLLSPTFLKGSNPDPTYFHFATFRNGAGTVAMHVRDATFGIGVSPTDTDLPAQSSGNAQAASLYIDWTLTLTVHNGAGNPVSGASVSYTNAIGRQECSTTTNSSGVATCVLTQYRDNNDTAANQVENHNPFSFSISATGCTTLTGNESITGTLSETKTLPGC